MSTRNILEGIKIVYTIPRDYQFVMIIMIISDLNDKILSHVSIFCMGTSGNARRNCWFTKYLITEFDLTCLFSSCMRMHFLVSCVFSTIGLDF
jgi:hypothetical protein